MKKAILVVDDEKNIRELVNLTSKAGASRSLKPPTVRGPKSCQDNGTRPDHIGSYAPKIDGLKDNRI